MSEQYEYLVRGASLQCSCGSFPRRLNLPLCHGVYIGKNPVMNSGDFIPEVNIMSFGTCSKTDSKCTPRFAGNYPWLNVNRRLIIGDEENYALTTQSYLECVTGGRITVVTSGQEYEMTDKDKINNKNNLLNDNENTSEKRSEILNYDPNQWIVENGEKSKALYDNIWERKDKFFRDINIALFKGKIYASNDDPLEFDLEEKKFTLYDTKIGIDLNVAEVGIGTHIGDNNINNKSSVEMDVTGAEASIESAIKYDEKGLDLYARAGAEAAIYSAKAETEVNVLGLLKIKGEAKGIAGGYAIGGEAGIKDNELTIKVKLAKGLGGEVGMSIGLLK
ncbi:DUF4280 domain-containing protein [Criibacterium bergeronii]|uniref:DUF4280 domain-containing protein n=1 Tax=Criibacterium bergeronii TaxID=1871336 RepID=A0A552VC82_9FIRM|nr:DUF4280 domain-containing protein [Criibacterium bergeronii]TRW28081.1 DUF4280 domain-containing protein [Criibacterium bergeronii]